MRFLGNTVTDVHIAYIGGGSRGWAWGLMNDLALNGQISGEVRLYDIDFEAASDNEKIGESLKDAEGAQSEWHYKTVEILKDALTGADFVVISILPGTFKEMASDVHTPEKYGIYQSVGDSVGPGGLIRALRTIPMYVEIANAIRQFCPLAWVINYTNPMTLCVRTLYQVFPGIKAFGCCHEVFGMQELFVKIIKEFTGIDNLCRKDVRINVLGINHFTWIDNVMHDGMDLMPMYRQFADRYFETGFESPADNEAEKIFDSGYRVKMDLFRRYGVIAAAGDRHLAEFCPPWYLKSPETVLEWKFRLTPVSYRVKEQGKRLKRAKRLVQGEEKLQLCPTNEEGVLQIKSLLGLGAMITNINLPNQGQMPGIPMNSVVETNAVISKNSVVPIIAGKLPDDVNNLVMRQVVNQETTLRAALTKNKETAFRAFANDPLMTASIKDARRLFDEMIENTNEYLPGW